MFSQNFLSVFREVLQMRKSFSYRVPSVVALLSIARNGCSRMMEEDISKSLAACAGQHVCVFVTASFSL